MNIEICDPHRPCALRNIIPGECFMVSCSGAVYMRCRGDNLVLYHFSGIPVVTLTAGTLFEFDKDKKVYPVRSKLEVREL